MTDQQGRSIDRGDEIGECRCVKCQTAQWVRGHDNRMAGTAQLTDHSGET
jgi:hypothetical protein